MKIISSDNAKIKHLKKLKQKKYRQEFGQFLVENLVIIKDGLSAGSKPDSLLATPEFITKNKKAWDNIIKENDLSDYLEISDKINRSFSNLENPSGIGAVYKIPPIEKLPLNKPILYLNSIGDPGNLGTIFRSALAFGFKNIILDETCVDAYNYKTVNAAKDAIFKINLYKDKKLDLLKQIKLKMPIISTRIDMAKNIDTLKKYHNFCLVLGDESRGVDKEIEKMADEFIKINISPEIESLNVATAAAIILHSVYK